MIALCILLFAAGHLFRDGWWPTGSTHAARIGGAILCLLGALLVLPWLTALIVGLGVLCGFYTDSWHAAGQGPDDTWRSAEHNIPRLFVSGMTSVVPLMLLLAFFVEHWAAWIGLAGFAKPIIWPLMWYAIPKLGLTRYLILPPDYQESFFAPTRIAAMTFGACIGCGVSLLV